MFDRVELRVRAGDGGKGAVSFRREKFVPFGGPDGGDGGKGGDVVVVTDDNINALNAYKRGRVYRAKNGGNGQGKKMHGKNGEDLVLSVPLGTLVLQNPGSGAECPAVDLEKPGQRFAVARGGRGGRGNIHFATSTNQAPREAEEGTGGEEKTIVLEMRLIADAGIIGYPNVGKSSLLAAVSAAKPKIANYPFTTLEPVLGQVQYKQHSFIMAEIPGLIEGAHLGKGLGHDFLRHAMRTRVFVHLVDGTSASPAEDFIRVNTEIGLFDTSLAQRPQVVAINKVDLPQVKSKVDEIKDAFGSMGITPFFISAASGEGLPGLVDEIWKRLKSVAAKKPEAEPDEKVFRPRPKG